MVYRGLFHVVRLFPAAALWGAPMGLKGPLHIHSVDREAQLTGEGQSSGQAFSLPTLGASSACLRTSVPCGDKAAKCDPLDECLPSRTKRGVRTQLRAELIRPHAL